MLILFVLINLGARWWVVRVASKNLLTSKLEVFLTIVNCSKLFIVANTFHLRSDVIEFVDPPLVVTELFSKINKVVEESI